MKNIIKQYNPRIIKKWVKIIFFIIFFIISLVVYITRYRPAPTGSIIDGVYAVRSLFINFYIIETEDGYALFDTGMFPWAAKRGLRELNINQDEVTHIFLSHSDIDHAGGVSAFPNAAIYLSKTEEPLINGKEARFVIIHNKKLKQFQIMEDGEIIWLGGTKIQIFYSPGHTIGSACYLIDDIVLVTGDLLRFSQQVEIIPFFPHINMNHIQAKESIEAMMPVINDAEYILTAHNGYKKLN
jgi:glyoxylase-like metal-dependent hydrolase (beta-lactamase superfamily II)